MFGGIDDIILILVIIVGIAIFGRAGIKRLAQMAYGAKSDIEEVKAEFDSKEKAKKLAKKKE